MLVGFESSPFVKRCTAKGRHIVRYDLQTEFGVIPAELYFAYDDLQFEVLKLVRTGDWGFNRRLCSTANINNYSFRFSGKHYGLFGLVREWDKETNKQVTIFNPIPRFDAKTEEQIITKVMERYYKPEERNFVEGEEKPEDDFDQDETDKSLGIKRIRSR